MAILVIINNVNDNNEDDHDYNDDHDDHDNDQVGTVTKMRDRMTASPPVLSPQPSAEQVFSFFNHHYHDDENFS